MNSTPWGGHSGVHGTQLRLRALFYWPTLLQDVKKNVADCETCQRNKGEIVAYPRLLQPLPISSRAWEHIAMDFIRLPKTYGKDSVLVVIDRYTKFAYFFALTHPYMATQVAQIFLDNVCKLHGLLNSIVSDRDPIFVSNSWKELFKGLKFHLKPSTTYHLQITGITLIFNQQSA